MAGIDDTNLVWKALADATRREILDRLSEKPRTTGEICDFFEQLCRTAVMKHLGILEKANLVLIRREGKYRWNYINPVPIQVICDRWLDHYTKTKASALIQIKKQSEQKSELKSSRRKQK